MFVNGKSIGRKTVSRERPLPRSVRFETVYTPGTVEAVSYTGGAEVSRTVLMTSGNAAMIRLKADGHDLICVWAEITDREGNPVPDAAIPLTAHVSGPALLAGFGTGNPVTAEDYTDEQTTSYQGSALAVVRAGYESGEICLTVSGEGLPETKAALAAE